MPEQFKFDFTKETPEEEIKGSTQETPEEEMARLAKKYKEEVGVDPISRSFSKEIILAGLANPKAELDRLREIDTEEDHRETRRTYVR